MALDSTLNVDVITLDVAGDIDAAWVNSGMPDNGLRIYGLRGTGNRTHTFLGAPGLNGSAPTYILAMGATCTAPARRWPTTSASRTIANTAASSAS